MNVESRCRGCTGESNNLVLERQGLILFRKKCYCLLALLRFHSDDCILGLRQLVRLTHFAAMKMLVAPVFFIHVPEGVPCGLGQEEVVPEMSGHHCQGLQVL